MKNLATITLVLFAGALLSACGAPNDEQVKGEVIQKASSAKLDKVIEEKRANADTEEGEEGAEAEAATDAMKEAAPEATEEAAMEEAEEATEEAAMEEPEVEEFAPEVEEPQTAL